MKIGDQIDGSGVDMTINDGDLVSDFLVIARVSLADGRETIRSAWSDGLGWVVRRGMVESALDAERMDVTASDQEPDA